MDYSYFSINFANCNNGNVANGSFANHFIMDPYIYISEDVFKTLKINEGVPYAIDRKILAH